MKNKQSKKKRIDNLLNECDSIVTKAVNLPLNDPARKALEQQFEHNLNQVCDLLK